MLNSDEETTDRMGHRMRRAWKRIARLDHVPALRAICSGLLLLLLLAPYGSGLCPAVGPE